jgi:glycosyltransferase involved in cell wall biosynthesis
VLYFGRLEELKGTHVLARALVPVLRAAPDLHAAFVGDDMPFDGRPMGEHVRSVLAEFAGRVHFLGRQTHERLYPLIRDAAVVVLPSLWENLPNACLEAMDVGRPIVATDVGGIPEVLQDGASALLVPPGDATRLADAVLRVLRDGALCEKLAAGAAARACECSMAASTRKLLDVYDRVTSAHRRHNLVPEGA